MGSAAATDIEKLWAVYYPSASVDNTVAAALQVVVWEDIAAKAGYPLTVSGLDSGTAAEVAAMQAALPGLTAETDLVALVSPTGQNYVVPEPGTVSLLMIPLLLSVVRRARR